MTHVRARLQSVVQPQDIMLHVMPAPGEVPRHFAWPMRHSINLVASIELLTDVTSGNLAAAMGDPVYLPFADDSVDVVICDTGLHHGANVPRAVQDMARVCRPGGYVAVCDDMTPEDLDAAAYVNAWNARYCASETWAYAQSEWREFIECAGLRMEIEETVRQPIPFASWPALSGLAPEVADVLSQELFHSPPSVRNFLNPRMEAGERYFDRVQGIWLGRKVPV
ncbi:MAG: hypothetical protein ETSY2_25155 [Candidatus Entotheonella gemina]|uniref:Methyltransferase type 11 domain-containing protein n=1 Tax=Candidatus Entotheonella gemina TaxID=1429439 RepID=W4M4D5_9BACT|nr:MAG: hypothetical protein ETSY2_25155 [Candidatus Entotheonella gemina]